MGGGCLSACCVGPFVVSARFGTNFHVLILRGHEVIGYDDNWSRVVTDAIRGMSRRDGQRNPNIGRIAHLGTSDNGRRLPAGIAGTG